ncbi:hypothetical protein [Streptomyces sp. NPDC051636]
MRVGPFIERAHPRPGDDHGINQIAYPTKALTGYCSPELRDGADDF